jgi:LysM repeat protein
MAAAVCISPQAMASPIVTNTATQYTSVSDTLGRVGQSLPELLAPSRQAVAQRVTRYTVRAGDSLSTIAQRVYHDRNAWPVIYWANHKQIPWANDIKAGQVLQIPAKPAHLPKTPSELGPGAAVMTAVSSSSGYAPAVAASTYSGGGGFTSCVIARESGGNSQVMNSSGHYGLYQFSSSTWSAYGGSAANFGHASVAEQNKVFSHALAEGGQSNWSAYDGC